MVLYDWQRGKIPYFTLPPDYKPDEEVAVERRAAAAVDEETRAQLPVPQHAVSEEEARQEAGALAAQAAEGGRLSSAG
jgi:nuclear GTP-binding protein